jgi:tetratricopeptide (TPR) repeat protein
MKALTLATAALLAAGLAAPATAGVLTVGGGFARSCYDAAEARDASAQSIQNCNYALDAQALTADDIVATHVNRGILKMLRGDAAAAAQDYDAALQLDPKQPEAWLNKAVMVLNGGDSRDASRLAQRALDLQTKKPALAMYIQAVADEESGNVNAAYAGYRRAAELEPAWKLPKEELKRYKITHR